MHALVFLLDEIIIFFTAHARPSLSPLINFETIRDHQSSEHILELSTDMGGDLKEFFKQAAMQVGAGGSAGFVEVCIMHPLDLVKTRLQLQATPGSGGTKSQVSFLWFVL